MNKNKCSKTHTEDRESERLSRDRSVWCLCLRTEISLHVYTDGEIVDSSQIHIAPPKISIHYHHKWFLFGLFMNIAISKTCMKLIHSYLNVDYSFDLSSNKFVHSTF